MDRTIDASRLEQFMGRVVGHLTGAAMCQSVWLGDELGLYQALAAAGASTSDELAARTGCHPRLVREWLDAQASGGLIDYDDELDRYELAPEAEAALADEGSPVFVARAMNAIGAMFIDVDKVAAAFRGDGGLPWGAHDPRLFAGTEWFFRTGYRAELPGWIAALDGVADKLRRGGRVADVGCGHGASVVVLAQHYPAASIAGFDFHAPSVETARSRAEEAGVAGTTSFAVADATSYEGTFDLICFFDCLHDMGDPVGIARYARDHLDPDGTVLLVEPFALSDRVANMRENPMAPLLYAASSVICTPNSLSQQVGLGLGAQAGEDRLRAVFEQAGFGRFRRVSETPLNLILEARP